MNEVRNRMTSENIKLRENEILLDIDGHEIRCDVSFMILDTTRQKGASRIIPQSMATIEPERPYDAKIMLNGKVKDIVIRFRGEQFERC